MPDSVNGIDDWLAITGTEETTKLIAKARLQKRPKVVVMPARDTASGMLETDWRSGLITNRDGGPRAILANALTALRSAPEWDGVLAHNDFAVQTVALKPAPINEGKPGPWSDASRLPDGGMASTRRHLRNAETSAGGR